MHPPWRSRYIGIDRLGRPGPAVRILGRLVGQIEAVNVGTFAQAIPELCPIS
jgi:hypothetical protein